MEKLFYKVIIAILKFYIRNKLSVLTVFPLFLRLPRPAVALTLRDCGSSIQRHVCRLARPEWETPVRIHTML